MAKKKSRQTFEKIKREQAVREKRERKQERKDAARLAKDLGLPPGYSPDEAGGDSPDEGVGQSPDEAVVEEGAEREVG